MTLLRSLVFNLVFLGGTVLVVVFGVLLLPFPPAVLNAYVRGWARSMVFALRVICGIRLSVTGMENLPPGGAIIAAKHQSAFDAIVWLILTPSCAYVLKKELMDIPLWGWLAGRCGHLAVDRQGGGAALRALVKGAKERLAAGRAVVIFPEGTRTAPGERVPYQPGVVALAAATGAPVVPAATDSGRAWGRRSFRKTPGVIHISVMPPLPAGMPRAALMRTLEDTIETETARLYAEPR